MIARSAGLPERAAGAGARTGASELVKLVYPRLRRILQGGVRSIVLGGSAADGETDGDVDIVVIASSLISQRMRLTLPDGVVCDAFVENELSLQRAIERGLKDHVVRMVAVGRIVFDDTHAVAAALQERAREALSRPRPSSATTTIRALGEPSGLLRKLERHRNEPVVAQLLYGELLVALLRARLDAERCWSVPTHALFEENRRIDPVFAGWVAVATRRTFDREMLPALRERVAAIASLFPARTDVATAAAPTPA